MPAVDRDRGMSRLEAVLRELENPPKVTVGVHADVGAQAHRGSSNATVATVAAVKELGTQAEGPTSYLRSTIDAKRTEIERSLSQAAQRSVASVLKGGPGNVALELGRAAARVARDVKASVRRLGLSDTGHLEESIEGRVDGRVVEVG